MARRWLLLLLLVSVCVQQRCGALESSRKHLKNGHQDDALSAEAWEEDEDDIDDEEDDGHDFDHSFEGEEGLEGGGEEKDFDEKDVVVLESGNFSAFVRSHHFVLVEFYAPWCGHCQGFAPQFAEAATILKGDAVLVKVDATTNDDLAREYGVDSYPSLFLFIDGLHKEYSGERRKDDVVAWVKKKTGASVSTLHSKKNAEIIIDSQKTTMAIALLNSLQGSDVEEYTAAARQDDTVLFLQTDSAEVAKVFNFPKDIKRPALVLLKQEPEKVSWFDGPFKRDAIGAFVTKNKLPLVITFNKKNSALIFESPIKKQVILFTDADNYEKLIPALKEASKVLLGKLVFVHVDLGDSEQAKGITEFFGISGDKPVVMGYEAEENGQKFLMEGNITADNIKAFGEAFLYNTLKPYLKSEPIPEMNDGDVKIVVGLNLNDIVLDETKDVFLEIYAPWCGHCLALESTWNKLARRLRGVESIVIAKMDGTSNEHPRAKPDGYPTLLFFPAGKKSFDPITFDGNRTAKDFVKFLKKEAAIPFTIPKKPESRTKSFISKEAEPSIESVTRTKPREYTGQFDRITKFSDPVIEPALEKHFRYPKDEL